MSASTLASGGAPPVKQLVIRRAAKRWYNEGERFFCVPVEVCYDTQLSHVDKAVLLAIVSYIYGDDSVFPSRAKIAERCGVATSNVSKSTRHLEELGWLTKRHRSYSSVTYTLHIPDRLRRAKSAPTTQAHPQAAAGTTPAASPQATGAAALPPVRRLTPDDQIEMAFDDDCDDYEASLSMDDEDVGDNY